MAWTVYMHTCPNGKRYVGITSVKPEKRWSNGLGYHNQVFYQAIKKYGWENIKHEILNIVDTVEDAVKLEAEYIAEYDTTSRWHGYNVAPNAITHGGLPYSRHSEATRRKMSLSAKKRGKRKVSPQWREKLRLMREKANLHAPRNMTPEGRVRLIRSRSRVVVQYEKDWNPVAVFESAQQAWNHTKINPNRVLGGYANFAGGFRWKYADEVSRGEFFRCMQLDTPIHLLTGETVTLNLAGV